MNPKLELCLALFLLLGVTPAGVWVLLHDIRRGETRQPNWIQSRIMVYRRDKKPADFWGFMWYSALATLLGFGLGVWALYDALQHI
jgi:hypothetical protein